MSAASNASGGRLAWWGNALALALLTLLALAFARLNEGAWWIASPSPARWWWAGVALAAYFLLSGALLLRAWRRDRAVRPAASGAGDAVWVVHASQTGFAMQVADLTADSLRSAGMPVQRAALEHLDAARLSAASRVLFVASTTGEGDPPDPALPFVRHVMARPLALGHLRYAVLALGDREYDAFCAFGHRLDDWLRRNGAQPMFDLVEVDNADDSALRHWQHHLGQLAGSAELADWSPPAYDTWRLAARTLLNPGSQGGPVFHLALAPPAGTSPSWQAGDIVEIGPRHATGDVEAFLRATGLPGDAQVEHRERPCTLTEALARAQLPAPGDVAGRSPREIAAALSPLPHREYSIASLPADGELHLLVRLMARADGTPGLGSGWLCRHAEPGGGIAVRLRGNPNFHAPAPHTPMILIGNGTGLAGLRAHLKARVQTGATRNWLLFGERNRAHDFFHGDELLAWQAQGFLPRLDLAFSRDGGEHRYVQHLVQAHGDELRRWVDEGAAIYVCGSLAGMAPGVDAALRGTLGDEAVERLLAEGRYRRDVY